jgi:hypothetical protein
VLGVRKVRKVRGVRGVRGVLRVLRVRRVRRVRLPDLRRRLRGISRADCRVARGRAGRAVAAERSCPARTPRMSSAATAICTR